MHKGKTVCIVRGQLLQRACLSSHSVQVALYRLLLPARVPHKLKHKQTGALE